MPSRDENRWENPSISFVCFFCGNKIQFGNAGLKIGSRYGSRQI
jgi:hypothetical protein